MSVQKDGWTLHDGAVETMQQQNWERNDAAWKATNRASTIAQSQTPPGPAASSPSVHSTPPEQK